LKQKFRQNFHGSNQLLLEQDDRYKPIVKLVLPRHGMAQKIGTFTNSIFPFYRFDVLVLEM
jgi:hypothetical protein